MVEIKVRNRSFGVHVVLLPFSLTIHSIFHSTFGVEKRPAASRSHTAPHPKRVKTLLLLPLVTVAPVYHTGLDLACPGLAWLSLIHHHKGGTFPLPIRPVRIPLFFAMRHSAAAATADSLAAESSCFSRIAL